ncbi:MAG: glycosyltransferase family 39 protein, partial [Candidatus Rokubacteria bacterium]|nr:glycosyltransferase family 39 protein [Candidatus Rokubacteria bacterium]
MLLLVIVFFSAVRLRLLDSPLERDEGEYAYAGQLMLQGIAPYTLAYSMKLPGTYAAYALIMAGFGQSAAGIHLGLLFVNAGTVVLMFLLGRELFEARTGLIAAASYALLSASPDVLGFAAHATNFVVLCSLAGVLALSRAIERGRRWRFAVSGGLLGLAVLMKQPGVFVGMFGVVWLLAVELRRKPIDWRQTSGRFASFAAAMLLPLVVTGLMLWKAGVFGKFWFWTVTYAGAYASAVPPSQVLHNLREGLEAAVFPNGT